MKVHQDFLYFGYYGICKNFSNMWTCSVAEVLPLSVSIANAIDKFKFVLFELNYFYSWGGNLFFKSFTFILCCLDFILILIFNIILYWFFENFISGCVLLFTLQSFHICPSPLQHTPQNLKTEWNKNYFSPCQDLVNHPSVSRSTPFCLVSPTCKLSATVSLIWFKASGTPSLLDPYWNWAILLLPSVIGILWLLLLRTRPFTLSSRS